MMKALDGKILRVDLSRQKIFYEGFDRYKKFFGGRGINQYILFREMPVGISPFDPSNMIAIGAGILSGTNAPGSSRVNIDTKNVFTGGIGSCNVGGNFGPALRSAGINNILITGKSKTLIYLSVDDEKVETRDASHLQQKTVPQVEEILKRDLGNDFQVMCIGPAGENLVGAACVIVNNARACARCGIGAIFGSKNLKAITVRGTSRIEAAEPERFEKIVSRCVNTISQKEVNKRMREGGVYGPGVYEALEFETPYRNFSGKLVPKEKKELLKPEKFLKYNVGKNRYDSCPINCGLVYELEDDNGKPMTVNTLQINSIQNFGAKLDMNDPRDILKAHKLCNDLGLDEDVTSNAIAWSFESYEKGIINTKDTDGLELKWGNEDAVFTLIKKIAYRNGFGGILGDGCKSASEKIGRGSEECCVHIKGNDLYECLWMSPPWAFGTVVSPRGGTHTRGAIVINTKNMSGKLCMKFFGVPSIDPSTYDNQEKVVVFNERLTAILDCLGMCRSPACFMPPANLFPEDYADLLSAATGLDISSDTLLFIGEKVHTLEKCFNVLHTNWTKKDDFPPRRFIEKPLAGKYLIDIKKWDELLDAYYRCHGWDKKTGWPKKETLVNLGLQEIYEKLSRAKISSGSRSANAVSCKP